MQIMPRPYADKAAGGVLDRGARLILSAFPVYWHCKAIALSTIKQLPMRSKPGSLSPLS